MKSIVNFFRQLFKSKKRRYLWDEDSLYDYFVNKYALSENGDGFYQAGKSIANFENSEAYVIAFINPLFDNMEKGLSGRILQIITPIDERLKNIEIEINEANKQLDEKIAGGKLHDYDLQINSASISEKEMESIAFPEKELHKMISTAVSKFKDSIDIAVEPSKGNAEVLDKAIAQKRIFSDIKQIIYNFQNFIHELSSVRHSSLHPPNGWYIAFFYSICLLLLCAEIGFSVSVVKGLVNPNIPGRSDLNIYLAILYCIGIAASSAILMKVLIETHLFKGEKLKNLFIRYLLIMFGILVVLFMFIDKRVFDKDRLLSSFGLIAVFKSIVISAFSISFALANAFLFREASYLHHLRFRLYGRKSAFLLRIGRWKHVSKWENKLNKLSAEKAGLSAEKKYYQKIENHVRQMFANLKKISLFSYQRGIDEMLVDAIKSNDDLVIGIMNKLKRKLK